MSVLKLAVVTLTLVAGTSAQELKIAAASDLSTVMQEIAPAFEKQSGIHVSLSFGSSGNFFAQIQNGAPFDVFLSADRSYPEKLHEAGLAEAPVGYARGKLVVWIPSRSTWQVSSSDLKELASPAVGKISIANPEHAPYGRAAVAAMVHFKLYDVVKPKLVLGENVSQAAQFAQSGNADVAFIPLSLALSDTMKSSGRYTLLPPESYPPLDQAGAVLSSSQNKKQAHRFLDFLRSAEGQKILQAYGFETPQR